MHSLSGTYLTFTEKVNNQLNSSKWNWSEQVDCKYDIIAETVLQGGRSERWAVAWADSEVNPLFHTCYAYYSSRRCSDSRPSHQCTCFRNQQNICCAQLGSTCSSWQGATDVFHWEGTVLYRGIWLWRVSLPHAVLFNSFLELQNEQNRAETRIFWSLTEFGDRMLERPGQWNDLMDIEIQGLGKRLLLRNLITAV